MVRAIYRWDVPHGSESEFTRGWEKGTRRIRRICKGALGSLLVRDTSNPRRFLGIARWRTLEDWAEGQRTIAAMDLHLPQGELIGVFDELVDLTRPSKATRASRTVRAS